MVVDYVQLAEHLREYHNGKNNAIKAKGLSHFGTSREIRAAVNLARKDGYLICSENCGYFYAAEPEDINCTINRLESYAMECLDIAEALTNTKVIMKINNTTTNGFNV